MQASDTMSMMTYGGDAEDLKKKLSLAEKKITKIRNENQAIKLEYDKAIRALEKETGEIVSVDEIMREDSQWKGGAQKIEILKGKIKKM